MFSCRIENSKIISEILTCLCNNRKDHTCHVEATPERLMFVVTGKAKSTQARVTLEADLFDDYICDCPCVRLAINLNMVLDCLDIFGSSSDTTTATITYSVRPDTSLTHTPISTSQHSSVHSVHLHQTTCVMKKFIYGNICLKPFKYSVLCNIKYSIRNISN